MTKTDHELSPNEMQLVQYLATGKSFSETASLMNEPVRNLRRWAQRPHVAQALQSVKQDVATHVREQIKALSTKAIKALEESLALDDSPSVRLKAAQLVLDRVAPEQSAQQQPEQPLQGQEGAIPRRLMAYLKDDELAYIDSLTARLEKRAEQAEQDMQALERKRM